MYSRHLTNYFEPFFYGFEDGYWSENCPDADKLEHYLIFQIRKNPKDLDSHVRRILLNIEFRREPQLVGALQDLYLALDKKNDPIKQNLLNRSQAVLPPGSLDNFYSATEKQANFIPVRMPNSYLFQGSVASILQQKNT